MKVKKLIEKLKEFDEDLEVIVVDEIEGNDSPLTGVEPGKKNIYNGLRLVKAKDVVYIRWY